MTEPTMRERVARAICASQGIKWENEFSYATSANGDEGVEHWFAMADAAIAAMREPTAEMTYAGRPWIFGCEDMRSTYECWRAMIDTVLAEKVP